MKKQLIFTILACVGFALAYAVPPLEEGPPDTEVAIVDVVSPDAEAFVYDISPMLEFDEPVLVSSLYTGIPDSLHSVPEYTPVSMEFSCKQEAQSCNCVAPRFTAPRLAHIDHGNCSSDNWVYNIAIATSGTSKTFHAGIDPIKQC